MNRVTEAAFVGAALGAILAALSERDAFEGALMGAAVGIAAASPRVERHAAAVMEAAWYSDDAGVR